MTEPEASHGTRLLALVLSMNMGISFSQVLKRYVKEQAGPAWDDLAMQLCRVQVEAIHKKQGGT